MLIQIASMISNFAQAQRLEILESEMRQVNVEYIAAVNRASTYLDYIYHGSRYIVCYLSQRLYITR